MTAVLRWRLHDKKHMNRIAFTIKLKPGCSEAYKKKYDEIWPELTSLLKKAGIREYSIFLEEETSLLFTVLKVIQVKDLETLAYLELTRSWWQHLSELMETKPDPLPAFKLLEEMFYLP